MVNGSGKNVNKTTKNVIYCNYKNPCLYKKTKDIAIIDKIPWSLQL